NNIRNMMRQMNQNQRQILQRIIRINQPKRMSITHSRTINFQVPEIEYNIRNNDVMDEMQIHSFAGSSLGQAQYNPGSSGSITYITEDTISQTHDLSDMEDDDNIRNVRHRFRSNEEGYSVDNQINIAMNEHI
ncbi:8362_t:CDS:1, partial [Cetraspora pellucida]